MNQPIKVKDVNVYMIIVNDAGDKVVVEEIWDDQGPGLGIMMKGRHIMTDRPWHCRYINPESEVTRVTTRRP